MSMSSGRPPEPPPERVAARPGGGPSRSVTGRLVGGRYRLDSTLGRGGMGVVWAGRDLVLERDVAVKEVVVPPGVAEDEQAAHRERTLREARTAARVSHDSVVAVYDAVEDDGRLWIVMERLPGRTLQDVLAERGALPVAEVAEIGLAVLTGLSAAHAAGVLHRDVKPSNVMYRERPDGPVPVLGDFGIAHVTGDATLSATSMLMGSPAYAAPERAQGKPATAASDLWSLGATLWAAVEGRPPFARENALATLTAVITEDVPPADHAGALRPVLDGLLRKDPDERTDAGTVQEQLAAVLAAERGDAVTEASATTAATSAAATAAATAAAQDDEEGTRRLPAVPSDPVSPEPTTPAVVPPRPDVARPEPRRRRPGWLLPLLALAVVLGLWGAWNALRPDAGVGGDDPVAEAPQSADGGTGEEPADEPAAPADEPAEPTEGAGEGSGADEGADPSAEPPAEETAVPDGFQLHTDETGFSVAVPAGWTAEREGPRVYLSDPASSAFLLVDQTDTPADDPVADWEAQEPGVADRLENYERIGAIEAVDFRGWEGADWEFVHGPDQGTHVLNRNVITSPEQAYALYWSVPSDRWEELAPVHEQVLSSFQPAP